MNEIKNIEDIEKNEEKKEIVNEVVEIGDCGE